MSTYTEGDLLFLKFEIRTQNRHFENSIFKMATKFKMAANNSQKVFYDKLLDFFYFI